MTIPTASTTLEGPIANLREKAVELINDIAMAINDESDGSMTDRERLQECAQDLSDMFFLVAIIGEFNAGKSTFVNSLIGETLLPIGITPTTEYIELVRFSEEPQRIPNVRNEALREWGHPNTGAPGVAIVDTPGTGSVFAKHEKTAKGFLHRSDLVIFVISAKHAFAETERLYLELAKNFGKKIILVVNQVDLLGPSEQDEVRRFIESQAKETLDLQPLLFMISAKKALEAAEKGSVSDDPGGVEAVKAHLRGVYSSAPPAKQKLMAQLDQAGRVVEKYINQAQSKSNLVGDDLTKVKDVQEELVQQSLGLEVRMKEAGSEINKVLEGIRSRGMNFIDQNMSVRNLGRGTGKQQLQEEFQDVVIGRSLRDINEATDGYINAVVDQSRLYWRGVIDRLKRVQDLMDQELGGLDSSIYAEQREGLQNAIRIAEAELKSYSSGKVLTDMKDQFDTNMGGFQLTALASISGIIVAIMAVLTPGPIVGVGAAVLALPALVVGGVLAVGAGIPALQYVRRIQRETKGKFNERVDELIKKYQDALDELTIKERNRLTQYGNQILTPVFSRLEVMAKRYDEQQQRLDRLARDVDDLRQRVEEL